MLVVSRKQGEKIYVGPDVVFTIVSIDGNKIRVGIDAPRQVEILRAEIHPSTPVQEAIRVAGGQK
jgi:carbon storage regulator